MSDETTAPVPPVAPEPHPLVTALGGGWRFFASERDPTVGVALNEASGLWFEFVPGALIDAADPPKWSAIADALRAAIGRGVHGACVICTQRRRVWPNISGFENIRDGIIERYAVLPREHARFFKWETP